MELFNISSSTVVQENATLDFKMLSLNARGIRSPEKKQALIIWLQKQKVDIIFLQETYSTKEHIRNVKSCSRI